MKVVVAQLAAVTKTMERFQEISTQIEKNVNQPNVVSSLVKDLQAEIKKLKGLIPQYKMECDEDARQVFFADLAVELAAMKGRALTYCMQMYNRDFFTCSTTPVFDAALKSFLQNYFGDESAPQWRD